MLLDGLQRPRSSNAAFRILHPFWERPQLPNVGYQHAPFQKQSVRFPPLSDVPPPAGSGCDGRRHWQGWDESYPTGEGGGIGGGPISIIRPRRQIAWPSVSRSTSRRPTWSGRPTMPSFSIFSIRRAAEL